MEKKTYWLFFLGMLFITLPGTHAQIPLTPDSIEMNFLKQAILYPQEKLYIHNDKPFYIAGEDIWFRVHKVEARTHTPDIASRYIYVEVINPLDSLVSRVKIRPTDKGAYHGHITLPEDLPEGSYRMRAYTRYMEQQGEASFFNRTIQVGGMLTALYRTETGFRYDETKNRVTLELTFYDKFNDYHFKPDKVTYSYDKQEQKIVRPDDEKTYRFQVSLNQRSKPVVELRYEYQNKYHVQYIRIPPPPEEYDVTFFPEGGRILAGIQNQIGFKAINSQGWGEDITGCLITEEGDTLAHFTSLHRGMGSLIVHGNPDKKLTAVCRNSHGIEKRFDLPSAETTGYGVTAKWNKDRLFIGVEKSQQQSEEILYLLIHCRGVIFYLEEWDPEKKYLILESEGLPAGVLHMVLINGNYTPVSERVVFNSNSRELANVTFRTEKKEYGRREGVRTRINLSDEEKNPLSGNFSVSITDDKDVEPDKSMNILSTLLLTSELKGTIEDPGHYFRDKSRSTTSSLDILMLTQGWSRYEIGEVIRGNLKASSPAEGSQEITGTAKGGVMMTRGSSGYPVQLVAMEPFFPDETQTDDKGRFRFSNFELPENTRIMIQAKTPRGGKRVELSVDKEVFPPITSLTAPATPAAADRVIFEDYMSKADQKYVTENGIRMIYLDEIEVRAKREERSNRSTYSSGFNPAMTAKEIEDTHANDLYQVLMRFAGVSVNGTEIRIRGASQPPLLVIDNQSYPIEEIGSLHIGEVQELEVVKDAGAAIFGLRGGNGAILITTKRGEITNRTNPQFNLKGITPLGYQVTKKFYAPQYDTEEKRNNYNPDYRSTIHWAPEVTTDEKGNGFVNFYTADGSSPYTVVIEGVTSEGKLIHSVQKIERTTD